MGKCQSLLANPPKENDQNRLSLKSTMDVSEEEGNWSPAASVLVSQSSLSIFNEDILLSILSYVADVPFEMMGTTAGEKKRGFEYLFQPYRCPLQLFHPKATYLIFANPM
jgi:hypothetical protein